MSNLAKQIVKNLLADFTDRRGFRQAWESVDRDIQKEVKKTWENIIDETLDASVQDDPRKF